MESRSLTVSHAIESRGRSVGGHDVARLIPVIGHRSIGPFVFFDHMGPMTFEAGEGLDVLPHPHVGLSTVTYLFDGEVLHQDSIGSVQTIRPGDINWMTAGRGIVHSERTPEGPRKTGGRMEGLQLWVGLPVGDEASEPEFHHYAGETLPELAQGRARLRVLAGSAYGVTSPVKVHSPLFYVEAIMAAGAQITVPPPSEHAERAIYVIQGALSIGGADFGPHTMLILDGGEDDDGDHDGGARANAVRAVVPSHIVVLGGAPLDGGPRHMHWNFVASTREKIQDAKIAWKERRFPVIPTDSVEFIPMPE